MLTRRDGTLVTIENLTDEDVALSPWNVLDRLGSEADMAAYLEAAMQGEGVEGFLDAAADVVKARALLRLSRETGIAYRELCKTFSRPQGERPSEDAIRKIGEALAAPV